jgi:hypothetical protein
VQFAFAAALSAGAAAYAAEPATGKFELTAFSNTAAGDSLIRGDYNLAIQKLGIDARSLARDTVNTNRCVALALTHQLAAAHEACDAAVRDAQRELANAPAPELWSRSQYRDYLGVAYSNRAVVNYLSHNDAAAQADLAKAAAMAPKAEFVARNLTALQSHTAIAQVSVGAQR